MSRWVSFTLSGFLLLAAATLATAQTVNTTGDWEVNLKTPRGDFKVKANIKQEGAKISGVARGPLGIRSAPVQGAIDGKVIRVSCTFNVEGSDLLFTLTGEVDGDSMKGKADFGGVAQGSWTAKRLVEASIAETNKTPAPAGEKPTGEKPASEMMDVSGVWSFEVETSAGTSFPTLTFKQEGETLAGQFKGAFVEAPLTGTVKGNEIKFSFKVRTQDTDVTIIYTGTIEKTSMKGLVELGALGSGTWTAKRQ